MTHPREHTFLFADLAGFSALTEAHGDERAADLVADFCSRARLLMPQYEAEEVKVIGDALMLRTDDARAGIELARRLVDDVGGRHGFPAIRVGVHTGPAIARGQDWFGATVNVAARVVDLATSNEVLVTGATAQAMGDLRHDIELAPRGERRLRNVREPVELFAVGVHAGAHAAHATDPVCRMTVDTAAAHSSARYGRRTFWFCSAACAEAFRVDPRHYAGRRSKAADLRVSDDSRERALEMLRRAHQRGRIDGAELEERSAHALAARTRAELASVLRDLPGYRRRRTATRWRRAARSLRPWRRGR